MYEIQMLQVLHNAHIDRIVVQRAPCATQDLCRGPTTFMTWYKGANHDRIYVMMCLFLYAHGGPERIFVGFFKAAVQSAVTVSKNVPGLYLRFHPKELWRYVDLGVIPKKRELNTEAFKMLPTTLPVSNIYCFDKVYTRKCKHCFFNSVDKRVATKFKEKAYQLASSGVSTPVDRSLHVLIARRNLTREMADSSLKRLVSSIEDISTINKKNRIFVNTIATESQIDLSHQVRAVKNADVVIATHGGFESNLIFMKG